MVTTKLFVPKDPALFACSNNELTRNLFGNLIHYRLRKGKSKIKIHTSHI